VTWIAPDVERSENYPARRNEPEQEMLRDWLDWLDWLDWHRATLLRKCAGLDATVMTGAAYQRGPRHICREHQSDSPGLPGLR
jgi:hypothetical protein